MFLSCFERRVELGERLAATAVPSEDTWQMRISSLVALVLLMPVLMASTAAGAPVINRTVVTGYPFASSYVVRRSPNPALVVDHLVFSMCLTIPPLRLTGDGPGGRIEHVHITFTGCRILEGIELAASMMNASITIADSILTKGNALRAVGNTSAPLSITGGNITLSGLTINSGFSGLGPRTLDFQHILITETLILAHNSSVFTMGIANEPLSVFRFVNCTFAKSSQLQLIGGNYSIASTNGTQSSAVVDIQQSSFISSSSAVVINGSRFVISAPSATSCVRIAATRATALEMNDAVCTATTTAGFSPNGAIALHDVTFTDPNSTVSFRRTNITGLLCLLLDGGESVWMGRLILQSCLLSPTQSRGPAIEVYDALYGYTFFDTYFTNSVFELLPGSTDALGMRGMWSSQRARPFGLYADCARLLYANGSSFIANPFDLFRDLPLQYLVATPSCPLCSRNRPPVVASLNVALAAFDTSFSSFDNCVFHGVILLFGGPARTNVSITNCVFQQAFTWQPSTGAFRDFIISFRNNVFNGEVWISRFGFVGSPQELEVVGNVFNNRLRGTDTSAMTSAVLRLENNTFTKSGRGNIDIRGMWWRGTRVYISGNVWEDAPSFIPIFVEDVKADISPAGSNVFTVQGNTMTISGSGIGLERMGVYFATSTDWLAPLHIYVLDNNITCTGTGGGCTGLLVQAARVHFLDSVVFARNYVSIAVIRALLATTGVSANVTCGRTAPIQFLNNTIRIVGVGSSNGPSVGVTLFSAPGVAQSGLQILFSGNNIVILGAAENSSCMWIAPAHLKNAQLTFEMNRVELGVLNGKSDGSAAIKFGGNPMATNFSDLVVQVKNTTGVLDSYLLTHIGGFTGTWQERVGHSYLELRRGNDIAVRYVTANGLAEPPTGMSLQERCNHIYQNGDSNITITFKARWGSFPSGTWSATMINCNSCENTFDCWTANVNASALPVAGGRLCMCRCSSSNFVPPTCALGVAVPGAWQQKSQPAVEQDRSASSSWSVSPSKEFPVVRTGRTSSTSQSLLPLPEDTTSRTHPTTLTAAPTHTWPKTPTGALFLQPVPSSSYSQTFSHSEQRWAEHSMSVNVVPQAKTRTPVELQPARISRTIHAPAIPRPKAPTAVVATTVAAVSTSVAASAAGAGGGAAELQSVLILGLMDCGSPFLASLADSGKNAVVPLTLGDSELAGLLGCLLLLVAGIALHFAAGAICFRLVPHMVDGFEGALGLVQFPSASFKFSGALMQGVAFECLRLFKTPTASVVDQIVSCGIVAVFLVPHGVLVVWPIKSCTEIYRPFRLAGQSVPSLVRKLILPSGYWTVSGNRSLQMKAAFNPFTNRKFSPFHLVPLMRSFIVAALVTNGQNISCTVKSGILVAVFAASILSMVLLSPFLQKSQVFSQTVIGLLTIAVVLASEVTVLQENLELITSILAGVSVVTTILGLLMSLVARRWKEVELRQLGNSGAEEGEMALLSTIPNSQPHEGASRPPATPTPPQDVKGTAYNPLLSQ